MTMTRRSRRADGFSLLELLLVVAIVGILAGMATTAYERVVLRARRVLAHEQLLAVAHAQERYRSIYLRYATDLQSLDVPGLASAHYVVAIEPGVTTGFRARATPVGRQQRDACGALVIDHLGQRRSALADTASSRREACW